MANCRQCSAPAEADAKFCSHCGTMVGAEIEVLGTATSSVQETTLTTGDTGRFWVLALAGLVAIIGLFWMVSRAAGDGAAPTADGEQTTMPIAEAAAVDDATTSTTERRTTSTRRSTTATSQLDLAPLLGEDAGLTLWIGGSSPLQRIDLDTMEVTEFETRSRPTYTAGDRLLLVDGNDEAQLVSVPLRAPDDEPVELATVLFWESIFAPGPTPDEVWVVAGGWEGPRRWQLLNVGDGQVLDEREVNTFSFGGVRHPDIAQSIDGGIFGWQVDRYRRLGSGSLVAITADDLLVKTCGQPLDCSLSWLDRTTWTRSGRAVPDLDGNGFVQWQSQGYRLMAYFTPESNTDFVFSIYDLEANLLVDVSTSSIDDVGGLSTSPDERYLAVAGATTLIYDLDTGRVYDVGISSAGSSVLLTATPGAP